MDLVDVLCWVHARISENWQRLETAGSFGYPSLLDFSSFDFVVYHK